MLIFRIAISSLMILISPALAQDNLPEYGLPWVPANTNPDLAAYANGQPPVESSNFYGLRTRDYEDTETGIGTVQVDHDFAQSATIRNVTRYGRTSRDSVITAPRFASVNTSTAINRQLQSRDGSMAKATSAGVASSRNCQRKSGPIKRFTSSPSIWMVA